MGLLTATKFENRRLSGQFGSWAAGGIVKGLNPRAWPPFATLGELVDYAAIPNFILDCEEHARLEAIQNAPRPAATPREPIRHDVLMKRFGWSEVEYGAALRIGFPKPESNGTGTASDWRGTTRTAVWTTYTVEILNDWLATVHQFGATLPKAI